MSSRPLTLAKQARPQAPFASIDDALHAYRRGEMLIVVDDEDRENEGDLTMAAEKITPDAINFMAKHGRGLICLPMTGERHREQRQLRDGVLCIYRSEGPYDDGHLGARSRGDRPRGSGSGDEAGRPRAARAHVSPARTRRGRAGAGRADGGGR